jgi:hypothetical protein
MPPLPSISITTPHLTELLETVWSIPPCLAAVYGEINFDLLSHARLGILKDAKTNFPRGRPAQQMLAASLHRYGRVVDVPTELKDARGEIFAAGGGFGALDDQHKAIENLEYGATITSSTPMAVPIGFATQSKANRVKFSELLRAGGFGIIARAGKNPLLVTHEGDGPELRRKDGGDGFQRARTVIWGYLTRKRVQKPLLTFRARVASSWEKKKPEYDRGAALAMTEAGRAKLTQRVENKEGQRDAFNQGFEVAKARALAQGLPKRKARQVAMVAGRAAKREFMQGE